jgi:hypothetical protein
MTMKEFLFLMWTLVGVTVAGFLFAIYVAKQLASLESRLDHEKAMREAVRDQCWELWGDLGNICSALDLQREPSTPARWVKKEKSE